MKQHQYFIYILTNYTKTVLYTGVTNNLIQRLTEHYLQKDSSKSFTGKYNCYYLVYFEQAKYIDAAIKRETQIKGWSRQKKVDLINSANPKWNFLNQQIMPWPPPDDSVHREDL